MLLKPAGTNGFNSATTLLLSATDKVTKVTVGHSGHEAIAEINNEATEVTVVNNTGNGSSVHPTTTTGLSSPTTVNSETFFKVVSEVPSSLDINRGVTPTSLTKANLQKLDAKVLNDVDFDIWSPLTSVHEFSSTEGVDLVLIDGPWMVRGVHIFLNKWSPSVSLLKEDLSRVSVWVKFHDVPLVAYTSNGLSLIAMKIGNTIMLDSYTNSICLESWGRSSYARILIEIDACNGFNDNLVMVVPNHNGPGYTKETIRFGYEWEPSHCSTCLIFGHSLDDCLKASKRVVNMVDKGKGGSSGDNDDGFIEVKKKKSCGNNECTKNFKPNATTSDNSSMTTSKTNASTSGNGTFSLSNSSEVLNVDNPEGKCVLVDDDGKPLKKVDYSGDHDSEKEVEPVENEIESFMASKPSGVGYGTNSLLEQLKEIYGNVEYDYYPYDDDMYEDQEIPYNNLYVIIWISMYDVVRINRLLDVIESIVV
nr:hypothetical protein [Tanacetum cinerariifolium]